LMDIIKNGPEECRYTIKVIIVLRLHK